MLASWRCTCQGRCSAPPGSSPPWVCADVASMAARLRLLAPDAPTAGRISLPADEAPGATGACPDGDFSWRVDHRRRLVVVEYSFPPAPDGRYEGRKGEIYFESSADGLRLLGMFIVAWQRRLGFRVALSASAKVVRPVFDFPYKNSARGGKYGYPDADYFFVALTDLHEAGVRVEDLPGHPGCCSPHGTAWGAPPARRLSEATAGDGGCVGSAPLGCCQQRSPLTTASSAAGPAPAVAGPAAAAAGPTAPAAAPQGGSAASEAAVAALKRIEAWKPAPRPLRRGELRIDEDASTASACRLAELTEPAGGAEDADGAALGDCAVCLNELTAPLVRTKKCGHVYHANCLGTWFQQKETCPSCSQLLGSPKGSGPPCGTMFWDRCKDDAAFIFLRFHFPAGADYRGRTVTAFLPLDKTGRVLLELFKAAFTRRVLFGLGQSLTHQHRWPTFNIHLRTRMTGGPTVHGFPDPTYALRTLDELLANGITLDIIADQPALAGI